MNISGKWYHPHFCKVISLIPVKYILFLHVSKFCCFILQPCHNSHQKVDSSHSFFQRTLFFPSGSALFLLNEPFHIITWFTKLTGLIPNSHSKGRLTVYFTFRISCSTTVLPFQTMDQKWMAWKKN